MTEQEYINVKELGTVSAALDVLKNIVPDNSKVIVKEDYQKVMDTIYKWQEALFQKIKIKV